MVLLVFLFWIRSIVPSNDIDELQQCRATYSIDTGYYNSSVNIGGTASYYYTDVYSSIGVAITQGWNLYADFVNVEKQGETSELFVQLMYVHYRL